MKAIEIKPGDRIRITTKMSDDIHIREVTVKSCGLLESGNYRINTNGKDVIYVNSNSPCLTIELLDRPKTPGEQAFDGYYSGPDFTVFCPLWSDITETEKSRWESAAQRVLDNCKS